VPLKYQHVKPSSKFDNSSLFVVKYQAFTNFRSDGLSQDKPCKEILNQKDKEKFK